METKINNIACRIFKEQMDLIQQLPENERAEVLYKAILSAFNQIENQNDIQIENQNEYAYVSVSDSVSVLGKTVYKLLIKNITCKEFSNNYGGRRTGAGRPSKIDEEQNQKNQNIQTETETRESIERKDRKEVRGAFIPPTLDDFLIWAKNMDDSAGVGGFECSKQQAIEFWNHYNSQDWKKGNGLPITNLRSAFISWTKKDDRFQQIK